MSVTEGITKGEIKFWMALIAVVVSGAVAFNTLKMTVSAMQDKGVKLREEYEQSIVELKEDVRIIRQDQILIMIEMGIKPTK